MGYDGPGVLGVGLDRPADCEIDRILANLHDLRDVIIDAWRDSPVTLLGEERRRLRDEIRDTCELLTALTS